MTCCYAFFINEDWYYQLHLSLACETNKQELWFEIMTSPSLKWPCADSFKFLWYEKPPASGQELPKWYCYEVKQKNVAFSCKHLNHFRDTQNISAPKRSYLNTIIATTKLTSSSSWCSYTLRNPFILHLTLGSNKGFKEVSHKFQSFANV